MEPKPIAKMATSKPKITVVIYSEKALGIFGDTKPVREKLKSIGAKFNPYLTHEGQKQAGWVISKKHQIEVNALISSL